MVGDSWRDDSGAAQLGMNTARRFLQEQAATGDAFEPAGLTGRDINAFLLRGAVGCRLGRPRDGWLSSVRS